MAKRTMQLNVETSTPTQQTEEIEDIKILIRYEQVTSLY